MNICHPGVASRKRSILGRWGKGSKSLKEITIKNLPRSQKEEDLREGEGTKRRAKNARGNFPVTLVVPPDSENTGKLKGSERGKIPLPR